GRRRGDAADDRRPHPLREDPLLGAVELSRLADRDAVRDGGAHGRAGADRLPAVLQPAEPPARGGDPAVLRASRTGGRPVQPGGARRADRQVRAGRPRTRRQPRRARRPADPGDRMARGIAGDRAEAEGTRRAARNHAVAVRGRLAAGESRGQFGHRGAEDGGAVRRLLRRARLRVDRRGRVAGRLAGDTGPRVDARLPRSPVPVPRSPALTAMDLTGLLADPAYRDISVRLLAALAVGGAIGLERSYHGRPAGFRTHALVCLSTSLLMLVTVYETRWFPAMTQGRVALDPTRMA